MDRIPLLLTALLVATMSYAAEPHMGPVFEDYGPVYDVGNPDVAVDTKATYRIVFDASSYTADGEGINRELETVARFMNMHAAANVPVENMELVVVLHGEALKSALEHPAYESRYGRRNPNLELLEQLAAADVRFMACGQSLGFRGFGTEELAGPVQVALSAMTALNMMQSQGYSLIP